MGTVVVQRGHVGRTKGATGAPGEQKFTTDAAARLARHLVELGHTVRVIDADVALSKYRGDIFVAIHYDSSNSPSAHGASVGYRTHEGHQFAEVWKQRYVAAGWNRGFRGDNYTKALAGYYGVKHAVGRGNTRAIIVEAGFHSNKEDAALLAAPSGPERVAVSLAHAIGDVLGRPGKPPVSTPTPIPRPGTSGGTCTVKLRVLKKSMEGGDVTSLQTLLNWKAGQGLLVDGKFGGKTDAAVKSVQKFFGLKQDGVVGTKTWPTLFL